MQTKQQKLKSLYAQIDKLWHGVSGTKNGDYGKIVRLYVQVIKLDRHDRDAWENCVWLLWSMSKNESKDIYLIQAETMVKDYLKYNPNGYRAYEYVGQFYRSMKIDNKLAVIYYIEATKFKDAPKTTFYSLISLYRKSNDKRRAIGLCRFSLRKFPNDPYIKARLKELTLQR